MLISCVKRIKTYKATPIIKAVKAPTKNIVNFKAGLMAFSFAYAIFQPFLTKPIINAKCHINSEIKVSYNCILYIKNLLLQKHSLMR